MRIIVDQWLMKDWNADRSVMEMMVANHVNSINHIYKKNVRYKGRQLKFVTSFNFFGLYCLFYL